MPDCGYCILHYIATGVILAAMLTTAWKANWKADLGRNQKGLFKTCIGNTCSEHNRDRDVVSLVALGFYISVLCDLLVTVHCLLNVCLPDVIVKVLVQVVFWTAIIGGVSVIIGCGLFAFENFGHQQYPGYSFGLALVGAVMLISAGTATARFQPPPARQPRTR